MLIVNNVNILRGKMEQNQQHEFTGGIFHLLKHFTIENYNAISHKLGQYELRAWDLLIYDIIVNFFSPLEQKDTNTYNGITISSEGKSIHGVYFKEENAPVYFIKTLFVSSK